MSQYIRDDNGNTYSLVNFLRLFGVEPVGESHNPKNDAMDLLHLYEQFISNKEVVFNEYLKVIRKIKVFYCIFLFSVTKLRLLYCVFLL